MSRLTLTAMAAALVVVSAPAHAAPSAEDVLKTYADIAHAGYEDSLILARDLKTAIESLIAAPSVESLSAARTAWVAARVPYQQTEVYRFGNPIVDEWEGRVNAWPLDEGLIDYVDFDSYGGEDEDNPYRTVNVIATPTFVLSGENIDATVIDATLLAEVLHEVDGIEANVATGYHAIEFLLWGQDLNGTGPGAGDRPHTDYDLTNCTGGTCDRRIAYLTAATDLLIADLEEMVDNWAEGGEARLYVTEDSGRGLVALVNGMGSLSYGELAGERMKLGLMLHDPEEEHDCFSDNTHYSHFYNAKGIQNVYHGRYQRIDGSMVEGPPLADLAKAASPAADALLTDKLAATMQAMEGLVTSALNGEAYDQMLAADNPEGNARIQAAIDTLTEQTRALEQVVAVLNLADVEFEGSDSLDDPEAVFQ